MHLRTVQKIYNMNWMKNMILYLSKNIFDKLLEKYDQINAQPEMDNKLLNSPWLDHIQVDLGVLMGIFERVGLCTKVDKTAGMVCKICWMGRG